MPTHPNHPNPQPAAHDPGNGTDDPCLSRLLPPTLTSEPTPVAITIPADTANEKNTLVALKSVVAVSYNDAKRPIPVAAKSSANNTTRAAGLLLILTALVFVSFVSVPFPRPTSTLRHHHHHHQVPTTLTLAPPPYSCAAAFLHSPPTSPPPCSCTIQACESAPETCCPDFARLTRAVTSYLVTCGVITGPIRRDLGNNMTASWEVSQWRLTSWGAVLAVGQECVRYPTAENEYGYKWECADRAEVVEVDVEVKPGWVDYVVTAFVPPEGRRTPSELVVGFGSIRMQRPKYRPKLPGDLFYLRLTDKAFITAVLKSVTAQLPYCGLTLSLDVRGRNGRAVWDPTPNRDWHALTGSVYSLARGAASPIEFDASPAGVDAEYEKVASESGGNVVPWLACYVRQVRVKDREWVDVVVRETARWVDIKDDTMWFTTEVPFL